MTTRHFLPRTQSETYQMIEEKGRKQTSMNRYLSPSVVAFSCFPFFLFFWDDLRFLIDPFNFPLQNGVLVSHLSSKLLS
jgi:hypothetical protein